MDAPSVIRAGDSLAWTARFPGHPASAGWRVRYRLIYPEGAGIVIQIPAAPEGDDHAVALAAAATASWTPGRATLACFAERGGERVTLSSQSVDILPDLATAGAMDGRSRAQRALDDLEDALARHLAGGKGHVAEYQIADRSIKFRGVAEIEALIAHYRRALAAERALATLLSGGEPPGRCYYRAGRA